MQLGVDLASVDGNSPPDFVAAKAAGARFLYLRKSQSLTPDSYYLRDAQRARDAGLTVGAYLFPSCKKNAPSPKAQVDAFAKAPGSILRGKDLPPALDIEFPGGLPATGRTKAEVLALLQEFVLELASVYGCLPAVYTSFGQWYDLGLPKAPWIEECPLWVKTAYRLGARQPLDQVSPREPHVGTDRFSDPHDYHRVPDPWKNSGWFIQQFQGDALGFPGFSATVDVNRFHSSRKGDSGPHVSWIQRRLKNLPAPFQGPLFANGHFDDELDRTVKAFQTAHGLVSDGIVGVATFAALAWL